MKINNDLERIGDLAVNIARKAISFIEETPMEIRFDIAGMWDKTQAMLRDSLDALVNMDGALAADVCRRDDEVDRIKHEIRVGVEEAIRRQPEQVRPLMRLLAVSRNLERIADCATNIAEDVIYMSEGRIIRHGKEG
jgi:phosphate transport system protein